MHAAIAPEEIRSLYRDHAEWLRSWLAQRTRCSHIAADLAQDTFCRLLERRPADIIRDPRNYLATVARRLLIDDIRRRDVERAYLEAFALSGEDSDTLSPQRIAEAADLLSAIMRVLEELPPKAQQSFLMIRFDGLRYADAASALGISDRMVKRYVAQAYAHCYTIAYSS